MDDWSGYRRLSVGWMNDNPAYIHPRILFGPGIFLDESFIARHKITHVINCAFVEDCPTWFRKKYPKHIVTLGAIDDLNTQILDWYPAFEAAIQTFIKSPDCQNIYVHCQCGINRSGFLAVAYACKKLRYDYSEVTKSVLSQRPCALTNPSYKEQVKQACSNI
jgi:protein-tyrosine phosphatase